MGSRGRPGGERLEDLEVNDSGFQTAGLPVVTSAGSPAECGEQHGEALRGLIAEGLDRWANSIASIHGVAPDTYIAEFVEGTDFLPAVRRCAPGLLDEIEGIAHGSAQPWQWIYAYNLLDEEWTWASQRKAGTAPGCTAAGFAPAGGATLLAQTMDIPNIHDGTQAVLRLEPDDGPAALVFTHAGMIALTGCNENGLAVVVNNLDMLPASRTGLPVAFAIRGILAQRTLADAVGFISGVPHATGQHYGIAAPEGLASVEGWATGVAVDAQSGTRLLHTNHPLYTDETVGDPESRYQRSRTRRRLDYLERKAGPSRDVLGLQDLLSDCTVPVSLGAERPSMTFGAVVYECTVPARMWVTPGPPHQHAFRQVAWSSTRELVGVGNNSRKKIEAGLIAQS
jgi:isopenicillin-N N-acyltransferase like protein